jgi:hypothetical protein
MFRWILVPAGALSGAVAAYILTALAYTGLAKWCPGGYADAGVCSTPWVNRFPFFFGGAAAALLAVGLGSLLAPARKRTVAWAIYIGGMLAALPFARHEMLWALAAAAVAGMGTAVFVHGASAPPPEPVD